MYKAIQLRRMYTYTLYYVVPSVCANCELFASVCRRLLYVYSFLNKDQIIHLYHATNNTNKRRSPSGNCSRVLFSENKV